MCWGIFYSVATTILAADTTSDSILILLEWSKARTTRWNIHLAEIRCLSAVFTGGIMSSLCIFGEVHEEIYLS